MRHSSKIIIATSVSFFVATLLFSVSVYIRQAREAERLTKEQAVVTGRFIAGELEARGARSEWPFGSLDNLGQREGVLFWWVVRDDGVIHLADQAAFMNTDARALFPELVSVDGERTEMLYDRNYGVFSKSFLVNDRVWHLIVGFSLQSVVDMERAIVFWLAVDFLVAVGLLLVFNWFLVRHLARPIRALISGVERIGGGDLAHRVVVGSHDEIGELAVAFNKMSARLKGVYDNLEAEAVRRTKELESHRVEFISIATHQLKTPITSIKWGTETLLERADEMDEDTRETVTSMHKAATGMAELVNALLNVSRLELGTNAIVVEPVSLEEELRAVLQLMEGSILDKHLEVSVRIGREVPEIYNADRQVLIIIYQNLLSNAVKYSREDGDIMVALDKTEEGIVYTVKDDGLGIPEDQQAKIFTKMFRADNAVHVEGTGLGLHIVKRLVESVGGSISFTSKLGKGSTFTVVLPPKGMPEKEGTRRLT